MNKQTINKIKELKKEGKTQKEIAEIIGVAQSTVQYWVNEESRIKKIEKSKEWWKKLPNDKKKELSKKRNQYRKDYYRNKYYSDEEYRKKRIGYSMKCNYKRKTTII